MAFLRIVYSPFRKVPDLADTMRKSLGGYLAKTVLREYNVLCGDVSVSAFLAYLEVFL